MKRVVMRLSVLGLVLLLQPIAAAYGQTGLPAENHYKVYMTNPVPYGRPIRLVDQFGPLFADQFVLERFANPAEKIIGGVRYPMVDPDAHQTWWRIMNPQPQPPRDIIAIDQFGYWPLKLGNAVYLLNPALKNHQPPAVPPLRNHYVCYDVVAGAVPLSKPVFLIDQFGTAQVVVLHAMYFCNPADKTDSDGTVYPIVDPSAHLNCYRIDNPVQPVYPVVALDQFGTWQIELQFNDCLCVPALKEYPNALRSSTWGKIKALYR